MFTTPTACLVSDIDFILVVSQSEMINGFWVIAHKRIDFFSNILSFCREYSNLLFLSLRDFRSSLDCTAQILNCSQDYVELLLATDVR